ncbi:hypothetical protein Poli38472_014346 [Pythium oligandrum]|uniref:Uncharacterized protein n=1 Tax=Pythium oligandrum TaxID=41045 RepID=A0A8K1C7M5_PYTOL|nr:hypothetical protein Poli38472_014346 [Pythium oligandrum]|eukprot:TMW57743.1 hypothetical protein Poli38472_014346 [Pythium oligandrum]
MDPVLQVAMERNLDLSRQNIASLAQIPSDLVDQVERDGETYGLSLVQNRLTTLADIQVFRNVRQLDLSNNNLQTLDGIQALLELESLVVARNKLTSIEAIASLQQLRVLNASENQLHQVDVLKSMPQIAHVDASYNNLTKWPQLSSCSRLQSVDLSSNLLEAFPPSAASRLFPRALRRLVVAKNQIHEVSEFGLLVWSCSNEHVS